MPHSYPPDPDRPRYHLMPPRAWMNEPHAPIQFRGRHHVFFQHNPAEADWGDIGWGHAVSDDLAHWEYRGLVLDPAEVAVAPDGVWSGSSVVGTDGALYAYFTAGDFSRSPNQSIARARAIDAEVSGFEPEPRPILTRPRSVPGWEAPPLAGEFRDPFVWREDAEWFLLVGSGLERQGGAALLFTSPDGVRWTQEEPLLVGSAAEAPATGLMWELPVLLPVGRGADGFPRHALFVSPWWPEPTEHSLQHVWHWIGVWDRAARRFTPDHREARSFDIGGHFTGPSGTVLDDGRSILWSIAQDGRGRDEHLLADWAHNAGLPLELGLGDDGRLRMGPVRELSLLREEALVALVSPSPQEAMAAVAAVGGLQLELRLEVELGGEPLRLGVRRSDADGAAVELGLEGDLLWVDRSGPGQMPGHRAPCRTGRLATASSRTALTVFLDGSMVEAYVNGSASVTTRAYPGDPGADGLALELPPEARVHALSVHRLAPAFPSSLPTAKDARAAAR